MQLTNIARDVGEDARRGRVYLPETWLAEEGLSAAGLVARPRPSAALARVVERLVGEAGTLYARADQGVPRLPRDCRLAIAAARALYSAIDVEIARRGFDTVSSRAYVPLHRKLSCVARAAFEAMRRPRASVTPPPPLAEAAFLLQGPT
jgi:phytoene synthase